MQINKILQVSCLSLFSIFLFVVTRILKVMNINKQVIWKVKIADFKLFMHERCLYSDLVKSFKWYILYMSLVYLFSLTLS